jgi:hypothetical protein
MVNRFLFFTNKIKKKRREKMSGYCLKAKRKRE